MSGKCHVCGADVEEDRRVCRQCGASFTTLDSREDERRALLELHDLMMQSVFDSDREPAAPDKAHRERVWRNAFFPAAATLLMEEVLWCQQLFSGPDSEPALERAESCLTRLELLATGDEGLAKKITVLKKVVRSRRAKDRRETLLVILVLGLLLGGIVWVVVWIVGKIFPAPVELEAPAALVRLMVRARSTLTLLSS